ELLADPDRFVVSAAMRVFDLRRHEFLPDSLVPNDARAVNQILGPRARALGWKERRGEPDDATLLRPRLVALVAVEGEDAPLAAQARTLATGWLRDRSGVDASL